MFPAEAVPETIGPYRVLKYLGQKGAADVYVARMDGPLDFQRVVTLKMVRFAVGDDPRFAEELGREAAICARLNHPAAVRMYDFFEHDGRLVLVLEQVEGSNLERLNAYLTRRKQKLSDSAIFHVASQVASALAHAHGCLDEEGTSTPVIHRDLRPENVLLSWDGSVRLAGFGLGKILGRTPDSVAGTVRGTPGFMAPEQARGERATVRSDVYGFGALCWALLSGQDPPRDQSRPSSLLEVRPDMSREIAVAIDAALEPSPDRRRITCQEIVQWMTKVAQPEKGREELRKKVLSFRSARVPGQDAPETARPAARPTRRRANTQGGRALSRRFSTSSFPAPASMRASPISSRRPGPHRPSSGPESDRTGLVQIPRPPGVPADAIPPSQRPNASTTLQMRAISQRPTAPPRPTGRSEAPPPDAPPPSMRPAVQSVAPSLSDPHSMRARPRSTPPSEFIDEAHTSFKLVPPQPAWFQPPSLDAPEGAAARMPAPPSQLPALHQILLMGLTAALVVALGLLFLQRDRSAPVAAAPQPPQTVVVRAPDVVTAPLPTPTAEPALLSGGRMENAQSEALQTDELTGDTGFLKVRGPENLDVYLNGLRKGPTNHSLLVPCGRFFMRLAPTNPGRYPAWIGRGETVVIGCKTTTSLQARIEPSLPDSRVPTGITRL